MHLTQRLTGQGSVVTGSMGGLGARIATCLAAEGASAVISGRRPEAETRVASERQRL